MADIAAFRRYPQQERLERNAERRNLAMNVLLGLGILATVLRLIQLARFNIRRPHTLQDVLDNQLPILSVAVWTFAGLAILLMIGTLIARADLSTWWMMHAGTILFLVLVPMMDWSVFAERSQRLEIAFRTCPGQTAQTFRPGECTQINADGVGAEFRTAPIGSVNDRDVSRVESGSEAIVLNDLPEGSYLFYALVPATRGCDAPPPKANLLEVECVQWRDADWWQAEIYLPTDNPRIWINLFDR